MRSLGAKLCGWLFYYFNFERNYDVLKSKRPCFLLNKSINFNKNETELKMKNPTHYFRETNIVFQLIKELQIKSKTRMSCSSQKKSAVLVAFALSEGNAFNICDLSLCIVS